jgi:hypothetical protein
MGVLPSRRNFIHIDDLQNLEAVSTIAGHAGFAAYTDGEWIYVVNSRRYTLGMEIPIHLTLKRADM